MKLSKIIEMSWADQSPKGIDKPETSSAYPTSPEDIVSRIIQFVNDNPNARKDTIIVIQNELKAKQAAVQEGFQYEPTTDSQTLRKLQAAVKLLDVDQLKDLLSKLTIRKY